MKTYLGEIWFILIPENTFNDVVCQMLTALWSGSVKWGFTNPDQVTNISLKWYLRTYFDPFGDEIFVKKNI